MLQEQSGKPKIEQVRFGKYEIDCWFMAPYPEEYRRRTLYVCEYCLKYMNTVFVYEQHVVRFFGGRAAGKAVSG